ncbi:MAG TPA: hypothetical protein DCF63_16155 [Planctomycetaceae bacterium]|nr:hypothetical protein [Planctomycetaceae bacterium]
MKRHDADSYLVSRTQISVRLPSHSNHQGFSLLEVILATVVLAGSAMILSSLLGQGAKFGSRAEQKAAAITAAQSVLDEFLAMPIASDQQSEVTGIIDGPSGMAYKIRHDEVRFGGLSSGLGPNGLKRITVEIFSGEIGVGGTDQVPLCTLTKLARTTPANRATDEDGAESSRRHGSANANPTARSNNRRSNIGRSP